jgi:hypothetical protein
MSSCGFTKTNRWFVVGWLMSYPKCNHVSNCAGSPMRFSSRDSKMENASSIGIGLRIRLWLFPTDGVLLEVCNRKERHRAWSFVATTSHVWILKMLFLQDSTDMGITLFIPTSGYTTWLCLCVSNIGQIHSFLLVYHQAIPLSHPLDRLFQCLILSR